MPTTLRPPPITTRAVDAVCGDPLREMVESIWLATLELRRERAISRWRL